MRAKSHTTYYPFQDLEQTLNPETGDYEFEKPLTRKRQAEEELASYKWKPGTGVIHALFGIGEVIGADPTHTRIRFADKTRLFITEIVELEPHDLPVVVPVMRAARVYKTRSAPILPRLCEGCGKEFIPSYKGRRFCTRNCNPTPTSGRKRRPDVPCERCGTPFHKNFRTQRFCSHQCAYIIRESNPDTPCAKCGTMFHRYYAEQRYCSRKCGCGQSKGCKGFPQSAKTRAKIRAGVMRHNREKAKVN